MKGDDSPFFLLVCQPRTYILLCLSVPPLSIVQLNLFFSSWVGIISNSSSRCSKKMIACYALVHYVVSLLYFVGTHIQVLTYVLGLHQGWTYAWDQLWGFPSHTDYDHHDIWIEMAMPYTSYQWLNFVMQVHNLVDKYDTITCELVGCNQCCRYN